MRFPIITDDVLSPVDAAALVLKWHAENYSHDRQELVARLSIDLHTQVRNLDDAGDPAEIGSWHLLASLVDYAEAKGIVFDRLAKSVTAYEEAAPVSREDGPRFRERGGDALDLEGKPLETGVWHLMASVARFTGKARFAEIVEDVQIETAQHPSPKGGM